VSDHTDPTFDHDFSDHHDTHTHADHAAGHHLDFSAGDTAVPWLHTDVRHGDPDQAVHYWFHQKGASCVPASVTQVLSEALGHPVSEAAVLHRMSELHMQLPTETQGVAFTDAERLLDSFGLHAHTYEHVSLHQLEGYLDQGRSVILGVDGDPIWHYKDGQSQGEAPHAVMITSVDETTGMVTFSDTGTPNGNEEQVPLSVFMHAWSELGNTLVVTDSTVVHHPGPALVPLTLNPHPGVPPVSIPPMFPRLSDSATPSAEPGQSYTVRPGDTLWDLAERAYGSGADYMVIAQANGITDPNLIVPGQALTIPVRPR
jgi:LysM domain/Peptidase_C39 like family